MTTTATGAFRRIRSRRACSHARVAPTNRGRRAYAPYGRRDRDDARRAQQVARLIAQDEVVELAREQQDRDGVLHRRGR